MPPTATAIAAAIVIIFMDVLACSPPGVLPRTMTRGAHAAKRIMLSHRCERRQACRKIGATASLPRVTDDAARSARRTETGMRWSVLVLAGALVSGGASASAQVFHS